MQNNDSKRKKYWIGLMCIIAAFSFGQSIDLYKDIKAIGWPTAAGNISWMTNPLLPSMDSFAGPIMGPLISRHFQFSYQVNGLLYISDNKSFGFTFSENFEMSNRKDRNHATVKVYFNPFDPKDAVLIPGPKTINIILITLGALSMFWLMQQIRLE